MAVPRASRSARVFVDHAGAGTTAMDEKGHCRLHGKRQSLPFRGGGWGWLDDARAEGPRCRLARRSGLIGCQPRRNE